MYHLMSKKVGHTAVRPSVSFQHALLAVWMAESKG